MIKKTQLSEFLKDCLRFADGESFKLELLQASGAGDMFPLKTWMITPAMTADVKFAEFFAELNDAVKNDAATLEGGMQMYVLRGVAGDDVQHVRFNVGSGKLSASPTGTEPATPAGLQHQHMRLVEGMARLSMGNSASIIESLTKQNERLTEQLQAALDARLEYHRMIERLQTEQHERNLLTKREETNEALKERFMLLAERVAPAIAGRVIGKIPLDMADPIIAQLGSVLGALKDEDIKALGEVPSLKANPDLFMSVLELYRAFAERKGPEYDKPSPAPPIDSTN